VPTDLDAPFLSEKGEVYLNGNLGYSRGIAAALALSDKTYLRCRYNGFHKFSNEGGVNSWLNADYYSYQNGTTHYSHVEGNYYLTKDLVLESNAFELGFGWYKKMEKSFMNEISFGANTGKISNRYTYSTGSVEGNFTEKRKYYQLFLQDDIGWVSKHFECSLTGRLNSYFFTEREFTMAVYHDAPDYRTYAFSIEGAFRAALGWKFLKPYLEIGGAVPVASPEIENMPVMFKGGLIARF
jgi:hypothetical protein